MEGRRGAWGKTGDRRPETVKRFFLRVKVRNQKIYCTNTFEYEF
jgi:hypothetical protein